MKLTKAFGLLRSLLQIAVYFKRFYFLFFVSLAFSHSVSTLNLPENYDKGKFACGVIIYLHVPLTSRLFRSPNHPRRFNLQRANCFLFLLH